MWFIKNLKKKLLNLLIPTFKTRNACNAIRYFPPIVD